MADTPQYFDLVTMGRIGVDLYPLQTGVPLSQVETFGKFLGGSAANVAVAAARLGRSTAVITRTGDDPFGAYLHEALKDFGVDDRWVTPVAAYPTPVTFCEIFPPDDFPLYFYRRPKAPDLEIHPHELDLGDPRGRHLLDHRHRPERGAEPHRHAGRPGGARQGRHHRLRPGLASHVLAGPGPGTPVLPRGAAPRHGRRRQPRRVRGRHRGARARGVRRGAAGGRRGAGRGEAGSARCAGRAP